MIKLQKGGVVRVVETQHEADIYTKLGYKVVSSDLEEDSEGTKDTGKTPEVTGKDDSKKPKNAGKKGTTEEE